MKTRKPGSLNMDQASWVKEGQELFNKGITPITTITLPTSDPNHWRLCGYIMAMQDALQTVRESHPASRWRKIEEFCPAGMQIKSPNGLSFDLNSIADLISEDDKLIIGFKNMHNVAVTFHRNIDGGPPAIYKLRDNIGAAIKGEPVLHSSLSGARIPITREPMPDAFYIGPEGTINLYRVDSVVGNVYCDADHNHYHVGDDGELRPLRQRFSAYGPGSVTDAASYASSGEDKWLKCPAGLADDPTYTKGWNTAINTVLAISKRWLMHRDSEEPPYHVPRIGDDERRELEALKKRE